MKTKNERTTSETFDGTGKADRSLNNVTATMMEAYKNQWELIFDFYNTVFNSMRGAVRDNFKVDMGFPSPFSARKDDFKSFLSSFPWLKTDGEYTGDFTSAYENFFNQVSEYNKKWLDTFQNSFPLNQDDLVTFNEKYQKHIEEQWETSRDMFNTLTRAYNKQLDISIGSNKEVFAELNKELGRALKINEEFWRDISKTFRSKEEREERSQKAEKKETVSQ